MDEHEEIFCKHPTEAEKADLFGEAIFTGLLLLGCILLVWFIGAAVA